MILTNRLFERTPPSRDAKSIYIFCEGAKREYQYFEYFKELDSRINIEVHRLNPHDDNSPLGLLKIAEDSIVRSDRNPNPKYNFIDGDEVWIVLDIDKDKFDSREHQFLAIKDRCAEFDNWTLVKSNPCFEVWLYYHLHDTRPTLAKPHVCVEWKRLVNRSIGGGFDSRRHPIYIETAVINAQNNFQTLAGNPDVGCTEVYNLARSIIPLISAKLRRALARIE
jgi:hypothetical protein